MGSCCSARRYCKLVRELWRPVGVVASPVLAGGISDQRARLYAGLDRPIGRASGGCQRDPGNRRQLVFATPARSRGVESGGARDLRRRLRRARRRGAGDMPYVPDTSAKIALTTIGVALPSVIYVIGNAVVSEIAPVAQRGAVLAIGTAVSTSAGLLAPYVMGSVVETAATPLDGFNTGFMMCGVIMLVGGVIGMSLMRPERETIRWASEMPVAAARPA